MEDEDWLDYVPLEIKDSLEPDDTEELLCFRKRGRGSMEHRFVPRLPLRAMIQRMKLLDESSNSGRQHGSRGRARILQDRARSNRPHGLHQKKQEKVAPKVEREVTEDAPVVESSKDRKEDMYIHHWNQNDFPSLGIEQTVEGSPKKKCKHMTSGSKRSKKSSDAKETERVTEMESCREESRALCISENLVQEPDVETEIVKPKTVIKKKFDFTKANKKLTRISYCQSGLKILV
ncbi:uncharacterized protein LOC128545945 [Mercenaria mercenaria]|uniref:uncharacterized protein LOC128545945 n=1 Tax=Mercenaria mercenaria TaxID=6596 RepID=UPI00234EF2BC|nr:uncharacterized protein LOC128545945 [Mercenaria mercenaria]